LKARDRRLGSCKGEAATISGFKVKSELVSVKIGLPKNMKGPIKIKEMVFKKLFTVSPASAI
jgi:hypothetical protein